MAGKTLNMASLAKELGQVKREVKRLRENSENLAAKFAYYWVTETRHEFAIVRRVYDRDEKQYADLTIIGPHCAGDIETVNRKELVSQDPETPKIGRWQPIVLPEEAVDLLAGAFDSDEDFDSEEEGDESTTSTAAAGSRR